jgi:hypothetical protein
MLSLIAVDNVCLVPLLPNALASRKILENETVSFSLPFLKSHSKMTLMQSGCITATSVRTHPEGCRI